MTDILTNPIFGIMLSILAYLMGMLIFRRFPHPITTPLLLATFFIIAFLKITKIPYHDYYIGGSYLNTLIVSSSGMNGRVEYQVLLLMEQSMC